MSYTIISPQRSSFVYTAGVMKTVPAVFTLLMHSIYMYIPEYTGTMCASKKARNFGTAVCV